MGISKKRVRNSHMVLCDFTENFEICAICMILNAFSRGTFFSIAKGCIMRHFHMMSGLGDFTIFLLVSLLHSVSLL